MAAAALTDIFSKHCKSPAHAGLFLLLPNDRWQRLTNNDDASNGGASDGGDAIPNIGDASGDGANPSAADASPNVCGPSALLPA